MDDTRLYARMHANLRQFCRLTGNASPGARVMELAGVSASVVPVAPDRSLMNSVVYDSPADLERALAELAATYAEAGIRAWTVWVHTGDERAAALLSEAGHRMDADPAVMCMELDGFDLPAPDDLDLEEEPSVRTFMELNDRAYGFETPDFVTGIREMPGVVFNIVRVEGRPVACAGGHDHEGDCCISFVATLPEARGRGLARKLMILTLREAIDRGCTTASLQSTKMGYPVYAKLGFRDLGPLQMWERREPGDVKSVPRHDRL